MATTTLSASATSVSHDAMANAIRFLSLDAVEKAKSGHPGLPMGMADVATVLWRDSLTARGLPTPWRRYFSVAIPLSLVFLAATLLL